MWIGSWLTIVVSSVGLLAAAGRNPAALTDGRTADAASNRRRDAGERKLELGRGGFGLRDFHRRQGLLQQIAAVLEGLLRHDPPLQERFAALDVGDQIVGLGLHLRQLRLRLLQRPLERPWIEDVEQVALLHDLAVLESHHIQMAGHAGSHVHSVDGIEPAGVLVPIDDWLDERPADGYGRSCCALGLVFGLGTIAGCQQRPRDHDKANDCHTAPCTRVMHRHRTLKSWAART